MVQNNQEISEIIEGYQLLANELYEFVSITAEIEHEVIPD